MSSVTVSADGERVTLCAIEGEDACIVSMSTRMAFDLVTELLVEIDGARAFGERKRGEATNAIRGDYRARRKT